MHFIAIQLPLTFTQGATPTFDFSSKPHPCILLGADREKCSKESNNCARIGIGASSGTRLLPAPYFLIDTGKKESEALKES